MKPGLIKTILVDVFGKMKKIRKVKKYLRAKAVASSYATPDLLPSGSLKNQNLFLDVILVTKIIILK